MGASESIRQWHGNESRKWLIVAALIATAFTVYANVLRAPFVFDDRGSIVDSPNIRSLWPLSQSMNAPAATGASGRPVTALSLAINYAIGGLDPFGYRVFNVGAHAAAAVVLYLLVRRTLGLPSVAEPFRTAHETIAIAAGALWVVHPLASDALNQVVSRNEILCGLFYLLSLYCVLRAATEQQRTVWSVAAILACALGMGSKEIMISAPLAVLLFDRAFLSGSFRGALRTRASLYAGLCATWLVLAAAMYAGYGGADEEIDRSVRFDGVRVTPAGYALTHLEILPHYMGLVAWPHPLVMDLGDWPIAQSLADVMPEALVVLAAVAGTLLALFRYPRLSVPAAVFFLILLPTSGVLVIADYKPLGGEIAAEHRMWFPLGCAITLIAAGGFALCRKVASAFAREAFMGVVAMLAVACAWTTIERNRAWASESTAWRDTLAKRPGNCRAMLSLGTAYEREGKPEESLRWYREAVAQCPTLVKAHRNIANLLARVRRFAEAEESLRRAHEITPRDFESNLMLGDILMLQGKAEDAIPYYQQATEVSPPNPTARARLAEAFSLVGREEEAIALLRDVVAREPRMSGPYVILGRLLLARGEAAEAEAHLETARRERPNDLDVAMLLASAQLDSGASEKSLVTFRGILQRDGDHLGAISGLAWLLATDPDPEIRNAKEAVRLAEIVCRRTSYRALEPLDTLAAALAAVGRFKEAQDLAEQALAIAIAPGSGVAPARVAAMRARLEGYRGGNAYVRKPGGPASHATTKAGDAAPSSISP